MSESIYSKCWKLEKLKELWDAGKIICGLYIDYNLNFCYKRGELKLLVPDLITMDEILKNDITLIKKCILKYGLKNIDELKKYLYNDLQLDFNLNNSIKDKIDKKELAESKSECDEDQYCKWQIFISTIQEKSDGQYLYCLRFGKRVVKNIGFFGGITFETSYYCVLYILHRSKESIKILEDLGIMEQQQ